MIAPQYVDLLDQRGLVDFDQQIMRAIEILLCDPEARAAARRTCGILLVDEFQDLTPAHLLLVRLVAGPRADVFGVGDDDQTILRLFRRFPGGGSSTTTSTSPERSAMSCT